jgi:hypothetical protein
MPQEPLGSGEVLLVAVVVQALQPRPDPRGCTDF